MRDETDGSFWVDITINHITVQDLSSSHSSNYLNLNHNWSVYNNSVKKSKAQIMYSSYLFFGQFLNRFFGGGVDNAVAQYIPTVPHLINQDFFCSRMLHFSLQSLLLCVPWIGVVIMIKDFPQITQMIIQYIDFCNKITSSSTVFWCCKILLCSWGNLVIHLCTLSICSISLTSYRFQIGWAYLFKLLVLQIYFSILFLLRDL